MKQRNDAKEVALREEATVLLQAILQIQDHESSDLQEYIDLACADMERSHAAQHVILCELPTGVALQASSSELNATATKSAMRLVAESSDRRAKFDGTDFVVGYAMSDSARVFVAEDISESRRDALSSVCQRLAGYVVLGLVGAVIVNVVLIRFVTRPLRSLVRTIRNVAEGNMESRVSEFRTAEFSYLARELNTMISALAASERTRRC